MAHIQFQLAVFAMDGELDGTTVIYSENLSQRWLSHTADFLRAQLPFFDKVSWGGPLSHISTSLIGNTQAAFVTFFLREELIASLLLMAGPPDEQEKQSAEAFVESLRNSEMVRKAQSSARPFQEMLTLTTRPLVGVVTWPAPTLNDQDYGVIKELSIHFCASYFALGAQDAWPAQ